MFICIFIISVINNNQTRLKILWFQAFKFFIDEAQRNYYIGIFNNLKWLTFNHAATFSVITF